MTNALLNVIVLGVLGLVCAPVLRRLRGWPIVWTVAHLVVLTLVFDTLMIDVGLYAYDPAKILGVYVWGAPLEDFAYPVAAGLAMPVLWTVLGRRGPATQRGPAEEREAADGTDA
ncbi:lycopene cyclase domain-containing protein [Cellulomonas sp. P22]|uniref:lycopene cyclase domain-containing protein n=1 Tax=Cellulomonas sp. P22 TaxID=3373189 RepID=UPI00378D1B43